MNAAVKLEMPEETEVLTFTQIRQAFALAGDEQSLRDFDALVAEQEKALQESVTLLSETVTDAVTQSGGLCYLVNEKADKALNCRSKIAEIEQTAREILESAERAGEIPAPVAKP